MNGTKVQPSKAAGKAGTTGDVGKPRTKVVDPSTPKGQFGIYVRHWIDKHHGGDVERIAKAVGVSERAVTKWCEGESAPDLEKLALLADAMGFSHWSALGAAAQRHAAKSEE